MNRFRWTIAVSSLSISTLLAGAASARSLVHSIWSTRPLLIADPGGFRTPIAADSAVSWQEGTGFAFAHANARFFNGDSYDFVLVGASAVAGAEFEGLWNVTRNGVPVCTGCAGRAYSLSAGVGDYFKIYVGSYGFLGYVTGRYDY